MDIQLFKNFALPPEVKMDIEVHENFTLAPDDVGDPNTSSVKRGGDPALEDEHSVKRPRLSKSELTEGVKALVDYYQLDQAQEENLITRAKEHKFVPTIDQVEWLAKEAGLHDNRYRLNLPMFTYMEYYPWYLRSLGDDHRVFVGLIKTYKSSHEIWASFNPNGRVHLDSPKPGKGKDVFKMKAVFRRYIRWLGSFIHCFQLDAMKSENIDDHVNATKARALQNAYIKAAMKVLARFPGLILERDPDRPLVRYRLYGPRWSAFPFKCCESGLPGNPLEQLFKALCSNNVNKAKLVDAGHERRNMAVKSDEIDEDDDDEVEEDDDEEV